MPWWCKASPAYGSVWRPRRPATSTSVWRRDPTSTLYAAWHTAVIEWTPQSVTFYLDGRVIGTYTNPAVIPSTPMHWVLQTETQLSGGPPSDSAAGNVRIDWVTAYTHN